jgi:hypothetical protein
MTCSSKRIIGPKYVGYFKDKAKESVLGVALLPYDEDAANGDMRTDTVTTICSMRFFM